MNLFGLTIISKSSYDELLEKEERYEDLSGEVERLKYKLKTAEENIRQEVDKFEAEAEKVKSLEDKVTELQNEIEAKDKELLESGASLAEATSNSDRSADNNRKLASSLKEKSTQLKKSQMEVSSLKEELKNQTEENAVMEAKLNEAIGMINTLQAALDAHHGVNKEQEEEDGEPQWSPEGTVVTGPSEPEAPSEVEEAPENKEEGFVQVDTEEKVNTETEAPNDTDKAPDAEEKLEEAAVNEEDAKVEVSSETKESPEEIHSEGEYEMGVGAAGEVKPADGESVSRGTVKKKKRRKR